MPRVDHFQKLLKKDAMDLGAELETRVHLGPIDFGRINLFANDYGSVETFDDKCGRRTLSSIGELQHIFSKLIRARDREVQCVQSFRRIIDEVVSLGGSETEFPCQSGAMRSELSELISLCVCSAIRLEKSNDFGENDKFDEEDDGCNIKDFFNLMSPWHLLRFSKGMNGKQQMTYSKFILSRILTFYSKLKTKSKDLNGLRADLNDIAWILHQRLIHTHLNQSVRALAEKRRFESGQSDWRSPTVVQIRCDRVYVNIMAILNDENIYAIGEGSSISEIKASNKAINKQLTIFQGKLAQINELKRKLADETEAKNEAEQILKALRPIKWSREFVECLYQSPTNFDGESRGARVIEKAKFDVLRLERQIKRVKAETAKLKNILKIKLKEKPFEQSNQDVSDEIDEYFAITGVSLQLQQENEQLRNRYGELFALVETKRRQSLPIDETNVLQIKTTKSANEEIENTIMKAQTDRELKKFMEMVNRRIKAKVMRQ